MITLHSHFERPKRRNFCRLCGYVMCLCAYHCKYYSKSIASKHIIRSKGLDRQRNSQETHTEKNTKPKNLFSNYRCQYLWSFFGRFTAAHWLGLVKLSTSPAVNSSTLVVLSVRALPVNWQIDFHISDPGAQKTMEGTHRLQSANPFKKKTETGNGPSRWIFTKLLSHVCEMVSYEGMDGRDWFVLGM